MKKIKLTDITTIGPQWHKANLPKEGYFIALKEDILKNNSKVISSDKIKNIEILIGLNVEDNIQIIVKRLNLNFNINTSIDKADSIKTAFAPYKEMPDEIYWRIERVELNDFTYLTEGQINLKLRVMGDS